MRIGVLFTASSYDKKLIYHTNLPRTYYVTGQDSFDRIGGVAR
jgi:hypothetical protein